MKNIKKLISLLLITTLSFSLIILTACSGDNGDSGSKDYIITVKDALGNPYTSGIIVKIFKDGKQIAMQPCDQEGKVVKSLESGEYDVKLAFSDENAQYHYNDNVKMTAENPHADVILAYKLSGDAQKLSVGSKEFDAYSVREGCTYVELKADSRNYYLFTPDKAGHYEISIPEGKNVKVGCYGAPHFVQDNSTAEVKNNKFTLNVKASMIGTGDTGTAVYVIGIDAEKNSKNCVLGVKRLGDPIKTIEDEPWIIYQKTVELKNYTLPSGLEIKEFDLTASTDTYKLVLNENDVFYHLKDINGPIVLVRLAEDNEYIACFKTMLDRSGVNKYFFENGDKDKFIKKESYSECLLEYIECVDEQNGVYPLTEDLKYIIQQRGGYVGWWNIDSQSYMFKDDAGANMTNINIDIAWLFMCCYAE